MFTGSLKRFISDESGQGITEYGAILAFVAVLVALVFAMTSGGLKAAISNCFSSVVAQLNLLTTATS
jgi:Flp pilus assembly pilin Flp